MYEHLSPGVPEEPAGPLAEADDNWQLPWLDAVEDVGPMSPPVYSLTNPNVCCYQKEAKMLLTGSVGDLSLCVLVLHWSEISVDGKEGGGRPGGVVGKIQEDTCFLFHVERGRYMHSEFAHLLPQLFQGRHGAHVLNPEPRGSRVEPGQLIWDLEAGLPERLVTTSYRGLACHFEACRHDCLDVVARVLIGGKHPGDRGTVAGRRMMADGGLLPEGGSKKEPSE